MQMNQVQSSNIYAIGYDSNTMTLRVQFKKAGGPGAQYEYSGVSPETFIGMSSAESIGRFFDVNIKKNGQYPCRKVG